MVEPAIRPAVHAAERSADRRGAQGPDDAGPAALLRPGPLPDPLLRRRAARLPHGQVLELADPADEWRNAVVRQRIDQLHDAPARIGGGRVSVGWSERE